jgi:VanZ family protein
VRAESLVVHRPIMPVGAHSHQGFVAGRHPSPVDVGIDAKGALIAAVAGGSVRARRS